MAEFNETLNGLLSNPDAMAQIMQLAQSLEGSISSPEEPRSSPQPSSPPPAPPASSPQDRSPLSGDLLSSLTGGMDPSLLLKLLPLVQEMGQDSHARQLLYALRPYLKPERQEKVERALQLAKLFHVGRKFLKEWGG